MQDIRDLAQHEPLGLRHWHNSSSHLGFAYCYCTTGSPGTSNYRIHIARKIDFAVLGSFPSWRTAKATMRKLYQRQEVA